MGSAVRLDPDVRAWPHQALGGRRPLGDLIEHLQVGFGACNPFVVRNVDMSSKEALRNLVDTITVMTISPEKHPDFMTYDANKNEIIEQWAEVRKRIHYDSEKIPLSDQKKTR